LILLQLTTLVHVHNQVHEPPDLLEEVLALLMDGQPGLLYPTSQNEKTYHVLVDGVDSVKAARRVEVCEPVRVSRTRRLD
jgi:hypothetical protein